MNMVSCNGASKNIKVYILKIKIQEFQMLMSPDADDSTDYHAAVLLPGQYRYV